MYLHIFSKILLFTFCFMKQRVVYFLILAKYTVCLICPVSVSVS